MEIKDNILIIQNNHDGIIIPEQQEDETIYGSMSIIIPPSNTTGGLFLGDIIAASYSAGFIKQHDIKAVITAASNTKISYPEDSGIDHLCLNLMDEIQEKIKRYFNESFQFIEQNRNQKKNVLVHCMAGISRSSTLTIAYLMRKNLMLFNTAYVYTKQRRYVVGPNNGFVTQLLSYQEILQNQLQQKFERENLKKNQILPLWINDFRQSFQENFENSEQIFKQFFSQKFFSVWKITSNETKGYFDTSNKVIMINQMKHLRRNLEDLMVSQFFLMVGVIGVEPNLQVVGILLQQDQDLPYQDIDFFDSYDIRRLNLIQNTDQKMFQDILKSYHQREDAQNFTQTSDSSSNSFEVESSSIIPQFLEISEINYNRQQILK